MLFLSHLRILPEHEVSCFLWQVGKLSRSAFLVEVFHQPGIELCIGETHLHVSHVNNPFPQPHLCRSLSAGLTSLAVGQESFLRSVPSCVLLHWLDVCVCTQNTEPSLILQCFTKSWFPGQPGLQPWPSSSRVVAPLGGTVARCLRVCALKFFLENKNMLPASWAFSWGVKTMMFIKYWTSTWHLEVL